MDIKPILEYWILLELFRNKNKHTILKYLLGKRFVYSQVSS